MTAQTDTWPDLRYEAFNDTRQTLHMYTQVIGKIRLALTPPLAQWAHAPLRLSADGLMTTPLWVGDGTMAGDVDLIRHETRFERSDGRRAVIPHGSSVADYYRSVQSALSELGVDVTINPMPQEVASPIPFDEDTTHHVYDRRQANLIWQALIRVSAVYDRFASGYWGKHTPPSYYWGGGDFGVTRYSGRAAQAPGGLPKIMSGSLDAESQSHVFTLGSDEAPAPAFLALAFPPPSGIETAHVQPAEAGFIEAHGTPAFALGYDVVRAAADPQEKLLSFLRSTYEAFADIGGWDRALLEQQTPDRLLRAA